MKVGIIGAGPIGILTSYLLIKKGHSVTLFEAGGVPLQTSELDINNYRFKTPSAVPDKSHSLGGGSNLWMGRIGEFGDTDFEKLSGVRNSDWPFKRSALSPHYEKIGRLLTPHGFKEEQVDELILKKLVPNLPSGLKIRSFRYIDLNSFLRMVEELKSIGNFDLQLSSYCQELWETESGKTQLRVLTGGSARTEEFDRAIVCGGAIQSAALILRSSSLLKFETAHLVGKGLIEHFDGYVGRLIVKRDKKSFWKDFGSLDLNRRSPSLPIDGGFGFALSDKLTIDERHTNVHLEVVPPQNYFYFENLIHASSNYQKNPILRFYASAGYLAERIAKKILLLVQSYYYRITGRAVYSLWVKGEEIASPESDITLDENNPDVVLYNHQISQQSIDSLKKALARMKQIFSDSDLGEIKYYRFITRQGKRFYLRPNWHPMGTLKMSRNPSNGVVREDFLFGLTASVYVTDSSIFSTGSNANPTFTALALASKLVEDYF